MLKKSFQFGAVAAVITLGAQAASAQYANYPAASQPQQYHQAPQPATYQSQYAPPQGSYAPTPAQEQYAPPQQQYQTVAYTNPAPQGEPAPLTYAGHAPPANGQPAAGAPVNGGCCDSCGDACYGCDGWNTMVFLAGDAWKNRGDDDENNNFGFRIGFNSVTDFCGWGYQIGASLGGYDFHGRDDGDTTSTEAQIFFTTGFFRRACCECPWTYGAVIDYMHDDRWGEFGDSGLNLVQMRALAGYSSDECNEWGVWSNFALNDDTTTGLNDVANQANALSQLNLYWRHYWGAGADTMCYIGLALEEPGEFVVGCNGMAPLNDCWSLFGNFHYVVPSTSPGSTNNRFAEETWNVTFGIAYHFGRSNCGDCGGCDSPLFHVADNGTFPVAILPGPQP